MSPTIDNYITGNPETNTHHRTQVDIIGSDPKCLGEGPGKDYHSLKCNPLDRTGQPVFTQR
jgi:hypothetical protein